MSEGCIRAKEPLVLNVWPGKAPGEMGSVGEEKSIEEKPFGFLVKGVTNVSRPTLTVFRPAKHRDTGAAVLVCPGGGFNIVVWDPEAVGAAAWLNSLGCDGYRAQVPCAAPSRQVEGQPAPGAATGRAAGAEPGAGQGSRMED